jgi:hypothetical protein
VCHSITTCQQTEGAQLTTTEQGHIPTFNTMDGITKIFVLLSMTLLLNVIDSQQYNDAPITCSLHEEEEIKLAQSEVQMLVRFLTGTLQLVDTEKCDPISVEDVLVSYQAKWLLWQHRWLLDHLIYEIHQKLLSTHFLQDHGFARVWLEGMELEDSSVTLCLTPLHQVLSIGFLSDTQERMKQKSFEDSARQASKRPRVDDDSE